MLADAGILRVIVRNTVFPENRAVCFNSAQSELEAPIWHGLESVGTCAVEHHPFDWASRSLRRESEEVIVVEVLIAEMFRSGRNRPRDDETSRGRRCRCQRRTRKTTLRSGWTSALKKDLTGPTLLEMSGLRVNQELDS